MSSSDDCVAKYYTKIKWNLKALHYSLTAVELLLKLVQDAAKCVSGGIERYIAYKGCQQSTSFIDKTVLYDHLHSVKSLIHVKDIVDLSYERVGPDTDGGYVMVKGLKLKDTEKIAYSFGIGAEPGWDLAMAERGYEVYMYDHTLDPSALKFSNNHCHFFPIGVCGNIAMDNCQTLQALLQKKRTRKPTQYDPQNGYRRLRMGSSQRCARRNSQSVFSNNFRNARNDRFKNRFFYKTRFGKNCSHS